MLCATKPNSTFVALRTFTRIRLLDLQQNSEALEKEERRTHQVKMRHDTLKRLVLIFGIIMTQYLKEKARTSKFEMMYLFTFVRCYSSVRFVSLRSYTYPLYLGAIIPSQKYKYFSSTQSSFPSPFLGPCGAVLKQRQASLQGNGFSKPPFLIIYLRGNRGIRRV